VVLHLIIQPANVPREQLIFMSKISSSVKLVNSPIVFQISVRIRYRILCSVNHVSRLKNDGQNKSCNVVHYEKANQYLPPCYWKNNYWEDNSIGYVKHF